jgi:hypothetical protein
MSEETSVADARHAEVWRVIERQLRMGAAEDPGAVSDDALREIRQKANIPEEACAEAVAWAERVGFVTRGYGGGGLTLTRKGLEHLREH